MSLTIEADTAGDKRTGCIIKYIPYKETVTSGETSTEDVNYEGEITSDITDISGFLVSMTNFEEAVEATEDIEAKPAIATIKVDDKEDDVEVGSIGIIGALTFDVSSATEEGIEVLIEGVKSVVSGGSSIKEYLKMNGQYVSEPQDMNYRELRLDKTVPFVEAGSNPECPEGKTSCKASEVTVGGVGIPTFWIIAGIGVIVLLMGKNL
jgi:hypothetical protein